MIAGLPGETWLLIFVATVPGLALVLVAFRVHRKGDRAPGAPRADDGGEGGG